MFLNTYNKEDANQKTLLRLFNNPNPDKIESGICRSRSVRNNLNAMLVYKAMWYSKSEAFPSTDLDH